MASRTPGRPSQSLIRRLGARCSTGRRPAATTTTASGGALAAPASLPLCTPARLRVLDHLTSDVRRSWADYDITNISEPEVLFDPGYTAIDADIISVGNRCALLAKMPRAAGGALNPEMALHRPTRGKGGPNRG